MGNTILNLDVFEQRFRSLFKEAPFSAALFSGDDFLIEMANEATLRLWGKDDSIIGKPLLAAMPEMQGQDVIENLKQVYKTGEPFEGKEQTAYLNVQGTLQKVYVNFIFKAIRDDNERIVGILAVGYDVTEQVTAKQKLEQSDTRARVAIESAGMGTFEKDLETGEVYSSKRFNEIFGFDDIRHHDDYISKIHPEDRSIRELAHKRGLDDGVFSYEARIFPRAGSERWIKINGTYLFNKQQQPVRMIGTVLDITDEKLSLRNLQESEERYRTLITETPEVGMALYTGPEIRIKYVNAMMLKFWDKDQSVVGKTFREALPVLEGQPFSDQLQTVFQTGIPYHGNEQKAVLEHNGILEARYFNYAYKPLRDIGGNIYGIHHMAVDVTDQVKYKLALVESEASVRRLFEQTPVGIAVFKGQSLVIEMANEAMLSYWGRSRHEVLGRPAWDALPEVQGQGLDKIADKVLQTGNPYSSPETPIEVRRQDRLETLIVYFAFQPLRDSEENIIGLLAIANDVTEMADARKKIEKNEIRLRALANSMPQVVWIAHQDGVVRYYNNRVQTFAGAFKTESGVWMWDGVLHPDDVDRTARAWNTALKTLEVYEVEHRIK